MVNGIVIAGLVLDAIGGAWYLLTHFGVAPYGLATAPVFFGMGIGVSLYGAGLRHPLWILGIAGTVILFLELTFRYNLWGLGGV